MAAAKSQESWATSSAVRKVMQGNRRRDTSPELAIRRAVHAQGLRYRVDSRPLRTVRRTADLVFSRVRVAVFVDGCFWHGCPDHYRLPASNTEYWSAKIERNRTRDRAFDDLLKAAGWTPIRVWEHEALETSVERIIETVRELSRDTNRISLENAPLYG